MIQQAFIDMENMFDLLKEEQEVSSAVLIIFAFSSVITSTQTPSSLIWCYINISIIIIIDTNNNFNNNAYNKFLNFSPLPQSII